VQPRWPVAIIVGIWGEAAEHPNLGVARCSHSLSWHCGKLDQGHASRRNARLINRRRFLGPLEIALMLTLSGEGSSEAKRDPALTNDGHADTARAISRPLTLTPET
jgi:hypothetical protein